MDSEIGYIHHVGHVVDDIAQARRLYQHLGFLTPAPAYPTLARQAGEPAKPFGAANTHVAFARNFIELLAVVTAESHLPEDAQPMQITVPPVALSRVVESIERTIAKISASLARFEGLHILVFQTTDAETSARRFDQVGVGHSGVNRVQQPVKATSAQQVASMGVIEIDREDVPEGRLAVAENPSFGLSSTASPPQHPNGAVDLIEAVLCMEDAEMTSYVARYQRYLGRPARKDGPSYVFDLRASCVRLVPASALASLLPGETPPALPAFVAYAVGVRKLDDTRNFLEGNGLPFHEEPAGGIYVPASATQGAAVIFRQVQV